VTPGREEKKNFGGSWTIGKKTGKKKKRKVRGRRNRVLKGQSKRRDTEKSTEHQKKGKKVSKSQGTELID